MGDTNQKMAPAVADSRHRWRTRKIDGLDRIEYAAHTAHAEHAAYHDCIACMLSAFYAMRGLHPLAGPQASCLANSATNSSIGSPAEAWLGCYRTRAEDIINNPLGDVCTAYKPVETVSITFHLVLTTEGDGASLYYESGVIRIQMRLNTRPWYARIIYDYVLHLRDVYGAMCVTWLIEAGRVDYAELRLLRNISTAEGLSLWAVVDMINSCVRTQLSCPFPAAIREMVTAWEIVRGPQSADRNVIRL